jgi:hypothetical protein
MKAIAWLLLLTALLAVNIEAFSHGPRFTRRITFWHTTPDSAGEANILRVQRLGLDLQRWRKLNCIGEGNVSGEYTLLFFLGSCAECGLRYVPGLTRFQRASPNVQVIIVAFDVRDQMERFGRLAGLRLRVDEDHMLARYAQVSYSPTILLLDRQDTVIDTSEPSESLSGALTRLAATVRGKG